MKDQERKSEDYLSEKAKEILEEQTSNIDENKPEKPEIKDKRNKMDEKAERESTSKIPFSWDPRELEHLTNNRKKMSNEELKKFFQKDSSFHENFAEGDWEGFSRWEERFIVSSHQEADEEEMAERLDRSVEEIKAKIQMMGLRTYG